MEEWRKELYLAHHGILGQKWGKRNGPPYPLAANAHSASERRAGYQESITYGSSKKSSGVEPNQNNKYDHSKSDKKSAIAFVASLALDVITLNPVGLAYDIKRGAEAASAASGEKVAEIRKSKLETDEKTGFKLKPFETTKEDDLKKVNPGFKNFDENTKNNCVLCSLTYDLRRRGYDVTANKASSGFQLDDVKRWYPDVKFNKDMGIAFKDKKELFKKIHSKMSKDDRGNFIKEVESQGVGARGMISVNWRDTFSGHAMAYEVTEKGLKIYDAQSGKICDPNKILSRSSDAAYARLDNIEPDPKYLKEVAN